MHPSLSILCIIRDLEEDDSKVGTRTKNALIELIRHISGPEAARLIDGSFCLGDDDYWTVVSGTWDKYRRDFLKS